MSDAYRPSARAWQDRFDTRRLADRLAERFLESPALGADDQAFVTGASMFFLATCDADGFPQCSYKGGAPGFVRVLDERTIAFPSYDGNGMFLSLGNIAEQPRVGLLFVDFERQRRLRLNGVASCDPADPLLAELSGSQVVVRVQVTHVFPNCPRYVHRLALLEPSRFVPDADGAAPVPDWKRRSWSHDVLPEGDPARALPTLE